MAERDTSKLGFYKLDFRLPTFTNATLAVSRNRTFDFHKCDCGLAVSRNRTSDFRLSTNDPERATILATVFYVRFCVYIYIASHQYSLCTTV